MKTKCSLAETCNFVGHINNKPNEEATQFTNNLTHKYTIGWNLFDKFKNVKIQNAAMTWNHL